MCGTCGCSDTANAVTITDPETGETQVMRQGSILNVPKSPASHDHHGHDHNHGHDHDHDHDHDHHHHEGDDQPHMHGPGGEIISLETAVLQKNDQIALKNRGWFEGRGVLALNLVSSPGAGKTTLLKATISALKQEVEIAVIEGDQMTANDAERIRKAGAKALQINTGAGCHLEADMVSSAVKTLNPSTGSILFIENVGNLVCPAMFDLGEHMKVAIISTTEGEDKPLKYPHMFRASNLVVVNKMDLAPHVDFDEATCLENIKTVNPDAKIILLSAKSSDGMDQWLSFLRDQTSVVAA